LSESYPLNGQVALVSGAGGDIGAASMQTLRKAGAVVVGFDLKPAPQEALDDLEDGCGESDWIQGDIRSDDDVARAVATAAVRYSRLDLLVHSAGIAIDRVLWKLPIEDWNEVHHVNLRGAFLLMRHAVPVMRRVGGGRIVLIGSINGSRGKFGQSAYAASKAGLIGLAKSAARETARLGILVNVVEPGMVHTAMTDQLSPEIREEAAAESLLEKLAEPEDVAAAVMFLCSPGACHITGQILRVDGGQYL